MDTATMLRLAGVEELPGPEPHVWARLKLGGGGEDPRARAILENLVTIFELDSRWRGRLTYTRHDSKHRLDGAPFLDADEVAAALWLSRIYDIVCSSAMVGEALRLVASEHPADPVAAYLGGLVWDEVPRLASWLTRYLGVAESPIVSRIGQCFAISAVARALKPGCKVDTVLVLVGGQGKGKSQAISILAGDWHGDTPIDPDSKDAYQQLAGVWIYELAEIDAFSRKDQARIKALISSPIDRFRPAYGRNVVDAPRRTVFVGTTNRIDFLADPTGSRRFWPVSVGAIDLPALRRDRDQLWAEAVEAYRGGARWWLDADEAAVLAEMSEDYQGDDPWRASLAAWIKGKSEVEMWDLLQSALDCPVGRQTKHDEQRAAVLLRDLGYERMRKNEDGKRKTVWRRK